MNFFKELDGIIGTNTITISVTKDKTRLIVLVVPRDKDGEAVKEFVPMSISGTSEQLDAGFMLSMTKSLELLNGIKANLDEIEKSAVKTKEKAALKSKPGKSAEKKSEGATLPMTENSGSDDTGDDEPPFDADNLDKETGEIKLTESAKPGPKAKSGPVKAATAKKTEPVQAELTPEPVTEPEPVKAAEDEW